MAWRGLARPRAVRPHSRACCTGGPAPVGICPPGPARQDAIVRASAPARCSTWRACPARSHGSRAGRAGGAPAQKPSCRVASWFATPWFFCGEWLFGRGRARGLAPQTTCCAGVSSEQVFKRPAPCPACARGPAVRNARTAAAMRARPRPAVAREPYSLIIGAMSAPARGQWIAGGPDRGLGPGLGRLADQAGGAVAVTAARGPARP